MQVKTNHLYQLGLTEITMNEDAIVMESISPIAMHICIRKTQNLMHNK